MSGKQALAGFLIMLALTGYGMTMGLNCVSLKPGAHALKSRVQSGRQASCFEASSAVKVLCVLGQVLLPSRSSLLSSVK